MIVVGERGAPDEPVNGQGQSLGSVLPILVANPDFCRNDHCHPIFDLSLISSNFLIFTSAAGFSDGLPAGGPGLRTGRN